MFLILLGEVGLVPSEYFRVLLTGVTETAVAETETVLILDSATFLGPNIVALSLTLTASSISSVLILLSVMLTISAELTLKT